MEYPSFFPETALAFLHALLYSMACILTAAAFIGLSVYIVLVCSEMFSQRLSKTQRAKAPQSAHRIPVAKETLDLSAARTPILAAPERLWEEAARATPTPLGVQIPKTIPATLKSEPTWS